METMRFNPLKWYLSYFWCLAFGAVAISFLWATSAHAASGDLIEWVGDISNRWEDATNWEGGVLPAENEVAIFTGTVLGVRNSPVLRSRDEVAGLILSPTWKGTLDFGTGVLTVGWRGVYVGSGRIIAASTTGQLDVNGNYTQTGGIVELPPTNMTVSGSLVVAGTGALTSTGTITFDGSSDQVLALTGGTTIANLVINNTGGGTSDDIIVHSTGSTLSGSSITVTLGNLDLDTKDIVLKLGGGITVANATAATFTTDANVTASGSISVGASGTFTMGGTSVLTMNGVTQNLGVNDATIYQLTIGTGATTLTGGATATTLLVSTGATLLVNERTITATTVNNYATITITTGNIVHRASSVLITDSTYAEDNAFTAAETVYFTLTDADENVDGTAQDTISMDVALGNGDSETITLTETANYSGIFRGSIGTSSDAVTAADGTLQVPTSTYVAFGYIDDGLSSSDTANITAGTSTTAATTTSGGGGGGGGRRAAAVQQAISVHDSAGSVGGDGESDAVGGPELASVRGKLQVSIEGSDVVMGDVPVDQWYAQYVNSLIRSGIANGYKDARGRLTGEFGVGNPVTYAEIAKMAVNAAGLDIQHGAAPRVRSAKGQWSSDYIATLEARGVSVFSDPALDVNAPAPRGDVVQIILETFGVPAGEATGGVYSDVSSGLEEAAAIEQATLDGIVSGDDGETTFRPRAPINRAETAKIIDKAMEAY